MALRVHDLACARGGVPILQDVSFTLAPGEALLLRGPNGSGKTTLLRTIAGLQPPLGGSIETAADSIAYGAHADGLKTMLSVAENLDFWAGIYGTSNIDAAMAAFNISHFRSRPTQNLSAGQKRRLGLARLIVTGRPVWALDEPTVSLDKEAVGLFAEAVQKHLGAGGSALIATHIDLGFKARELDIGQFRSTVVFQSYFDEAFQ